MAKRAEELATAPPDRSRVRTRLRRENFPVAARILPPVHRRDLLALYTFARVVDDIGDESPGNRLAELDQVSADLDALFRPSPPPHPRYPGLADTIARHALPREPFDRLVEANRQDQVVRRYPTFGDLLSYCSLSAEPVGRLVLRVFGADSEDLVRLSDRVCTALQLLEHCQDVTEDLAADRIYLPLEDLERFGVEPGDLRAERASRPVRALLGFQVQRAVRLLDAGTPLVGALQGVARVAVAGYVAGGRATAQALADARFDVLARTPRPARGRLAVEWLGLLASGGAR